MSRWGWNPYVPVATRQARAKKKIEKLRKQGACIEPVVIAGRTISKSFWGKGWCDHLESFSDYDNRLPRGRTYVRNGSVCHLAVSAGKIEAMVSGSDMYTVTITIKELEKSKWERIKQGCAGKVGSLIELLQGKLSSEVMSVVTERQQGLFPLPGEIELDCSCPDWATMCKHVAAVLYGVGSRLDSDPGLLFVLRGVDAQELIAQGVLLPEAAESRPDVLHEDSLADIFGIDLEDPVQPVKRGSDHLPAAEAQAPTKKTTVKPRTITATAAGAASEKQSRSRTTATRRAASTAVEQSPPSISSRATAEPTTRSRKTSKDRASNGRDSKATGPDKPSKVKSNPVLEASAQADAGIETPARAAKSKAKTKSAQPSIQPPKPKPFVPSGSSIARLRRQSGLSVPDFAARLNVSAGSVYRWENSRGRLSIHERCVEALQRLHAELETA
ncbi:helix-turn-helix domain-containing protein [Desulfonatronum parangueonense]